MIKKTKTEMDGFQKVVNEMISLKQNKAVDYKNIWRAFGLEGVNSSIARKFTRIWINRGNKNIKNESLRDSYMDMAVYSIMAIQLIDENDTDDKIEKILKS